MGKTIQQRIFQIIFPSKEEHLPIPKQEKVTGFKNKGKQYIFVPADVEIETLEFSSLSVLGRTVDFRGKLRIKLVGYPSVIKKDLQENLKIALFNRKIFLTLSRGGAKYKDIDERTLLLTYEFSYEVPWTPDLTFLPFDAQCIPLCIEIVPIKRGNMRYYFNIMNKDEKDRKEYFLPGQIDFSGLEDFILYYCQARYESVQSTIGKKKVEYFPQITLYFALTRSPWNYFLIILVPNFILQLLSIILFFTDNNFEERLKNITVLILAIIAFLPTVRAGLPHIPYITLMDLIIYTSVANLGLCVLETSLKREDDDYKNRVWFILACILVFLTSVLIGACMFYRMFEYVWMFKKTLDRKKAIEKEIQDQISRKPSLETYGSLFHDELESAGKGAQAVAGIAIETVPPRASAESRQSQEVEQNGVEPPKGESLTCMEKRYVEREVELREGPKEKLKTIIETPEMCL